jgi:3-oxoacyl-[acyl-carrier protein] reductase
VINGLDPARLEETAVELRRKTSATVRSVRADINTDEGRQALLAACPEPDILINNNAGPPPGDFQDWERADWMGAIESNMLAPIFMIRAVLPGMRSRRFGRIVNITSAMVKSPKFPEMALSTAARTALTGLSKSISRTVVADNVVINNLLPERIDTDRQLFMARRIMSESGVTLDEARLRIANSLPAKRFGRPEEFGDTCAFLCSDQAGFMTGQNLQLDGGSYEGIV